MQWTFHAEESAVDSPPAGVSFGGTDDAAQRDLPSVIACVRTKMSGMVVPTQPNAVVLGDAVAVET